MMHATSSTPATGTRRPSRTTAAAAATLLALFALAGACDRPAQPRATLSVASVLADADTVGFERADRPREFVFPDDHGPHPAFRHEWWYYTGNLTAADGRRFGFQLTFFRSALRPGRGDVDSEWATDQAYMAHFAVSDLDGGTFHAFERFDRGALGLAGAAAAPFRVHVGDWVAREVPGAGAPEFPAVELTAAGDDVAIALVVEPVKPVVFQGDGGWSLKGPEPGNASYYYSLTRLASRGTVTVGGQAVPVEGLAWLDREWGTSALGAELEGWDWFSIQMDDRTELMVYVLRRRDGGMDPLSRGSFVHPDGRATSLLADDITLEPTGRWRSPRGGEYPSGWRLRVPRLGLELDVEPALRDQEMDLSFRYWEGAVTVRGEREGRTVSGAGYVELTGYAEVGGTGRASP